MRFKFINDWQYLFNKNNLGGRFSAFTLFNLSYMHTRLDTENLKIDGLCLIILGLGLKVGRKS